jgi:hypothetical protein
MRRTIVSVMAIVCVFPLGSEAAAGVERSDACASLIPADLNTFIKHTFSDYRPPLQSDYSPEDIAANVAHGGNGCLGLATGLYYGSNIINYAVNITSIKKEHTKLIIVTRGQGATWKLEFAADLGDEPGGDLYVSTVPPGTYQSFDPTGPINSPIERKRFTARQPGIESGKIGSASEVFFFDGKDWIYVLTSD